MTDTYDHFPEFTRYYDPLGVHPHDIPETGIFDSPGVNVFINAHWASHITGMIERLIYLDAWKGTEAERYAAIDNVVKIVAEFDKAENQGDKRIVQNYSPFYMHFHQNSKVTNGNPIAGFVNAAQEFSFSWRQSTAAINDECYFSVLLPAGQIDLDICHLKSSSSGIANIELNGESATSWNVDLYNSATQTNIHTILPFVVSQDGLQRFKIKVGSKNAASSGYIFSVTYFSIRPHNV